MIGLNESWSISSIGRRILLSEGYIFIYKHVAKDLQVTDVSHFSNVNAWSSEAAMLEGKETRKNKQTRSTAQLREMLYKLH